MAPKATPKQTSAAKSKRSHPEEGASLGIPGARRVYSKVVGDYVVQCDSMKAARAFIWAASRRQLK